MQAHVPHGPGLSVGPGARPALLRAAGHRAGRGEQIQILGQAVDRGRQGRAPAQTEVSPS